MGASHPLQTAVEPVINTHPAPTAGEEQTEQQYEVGGGELDAVVEDDQAAAAGQPVVVAVLLQQCLGPCELFGGGGDAVVGKERTGVCNGWPVLGLVLGKSGYQHGDHQRNTDPAGRKAD